LKTSIFSDTHDNIWRLDVALARMQDADVMIHCGDLCSPFVIKHLGRAAKERPVHIVWGNNEGDIQLICEVAGRYPNIQLHGSFAELELEGLKVAVNHYPEMARALASSGKYDLVCFGHTHAALQEQIGQCMLLNPGELMGMNGAATFAWFDTETRKVEFVEVDSGH
jgi:putative phosphoesterase